MSQRTSSPFVGSTTHLPTMEKSIKMISGEYSQHISGMTIGLTTLNDFLSLLSVTRYGVIPGIGWGIYKDVKCSYCGSVEEEIYARIGSRGYVCQRCGAYTNFSWIYKIEGIGGDGSCLCPIGWKYARIVR